MAEYEYMPQHPVQSALEHGSGWRGLETSLLQHFFFFKEEIKIQVQNDLPELYEAVKRQKLGVALAGRLGGHQEEGFP